MKPMIPWRHVHFTGIGGVGMSGLAHILMDWGVAVSGTDSAASEALDALHARGAHVRIGHDPDMLAGAGMLVYSSAVAPDNPERRVARECGVRTLRRGEFLAVLAEQFETVIAVAGSHGKTTTTAMLAHILRASGARPGYLVGGNVTGWPRSATAGAGRLLVTEVDESDGTQALLRSAHAIIVNVEDDHCWSVGGEAALERIFLEFAARAAELTTWDTPRTRALFATHPAVRFVSAADTPGGLRLGVPGDCNRTNATLALLVAMRLGVTPEQASAALACFPGVARRLTERLRTPAGRTVLVEDYAHHPTELRAALQALRESYPEHRLVAVFQPHRFERVKRYAVEFAHILATADRVVVRAPFAAWIDDGQLADPRDIARAVNGPPVVYHDGALADLAQELVPTAAADAAAEKQVIAVIGAGDIGNLVPLLNRRISEAFLDSCHPALQAGAAPAALARDRSWAALTTLGVGRARPLLAQPATLAELSALRQTAQRLGLATRVIGAGSNLVGSDDCGLELVISLNRGEFGAWRVEPDRIVAGAGVRLPELVRGLAGIGRLDPEAAPLGWIPGTVGAALRGNAGCDGFVFGQLVVEVQGLLPDGTAWQAPGAAVAWGYRAAGGLPEGLIVTRVVLAAPESDPKPALERLATSGEQRRGRLPAGRSAGSVFRNPPGQAAGQLIDEAGGKGMRSGGCVVSPVHANVIVNDDNGSEADFLDLVLRVRAAVFRRHGVVLEPEVVFVGAASAARIARQTGWFEPSPRGMAR